MNRIVKRHYPVSKLPDDLREGIDDAGHVTVTVEPEEALAEPAMTLEEIFEGRRPPYRTVEEVDEAIDHGRDDRGK